MNATTIQARKTVILGFLVVIFVYTFGGLWGKGSLPNPVKYYGATMAYMALAVAAEFVPPLAMAFAILFAFYILSRSLPDIKTIAGNNFGNIQPSVQSQAQQAPGLQGKSTVKIQ